MSCIHVCVVLCDLQAKVLNSKKGMIYVPISCSHVLFLVTFLSLAIINYMYMVTFPVSIKADSHYKLNVTQSMINLT